MRAQHQLLAVAVLAITSCVPLRDSGVQAPPSESDLAVVASTQTPVVFAGASVVLAAMSIGGSPPYLFRWDQNSGPMDLALSNVTDSTLATGPMAVPGAYIFRVVATDGAGAHATDYITVRVQSAVATTVPKLAVVGEPITLSATLATPPGAATLFWEVTSGQASLSSPISLNPALTTESAGTIKLRLTTTILSASGDPAATTHDFEIQSVIDLTPLIRIETNLGDFSIELNGEAAPLHTANFLFYVDDGFYEGLLIHRVVCQITSPDGECDPFVVQGGGYRRVNDEIEEVPPTRDPVPSEANNGLTNGTVYSVALALSGGDPNSGSTQFFINMNAQNSFLDDRGFTVFGRVADGTNVVDDIAATVTIAGPIIPGEVSFPAEDVIIVRVSRME